MISVTSAVGAARAYRALTLFPNHDRKVIVSYENRRTKSRRIIIIAAAFMSVHSIEFEKQSRKHLWILKFLIKAI